MIKREKFGLPFDVVSPCHWQLAGSPVELAFLGDVWFLFVEYPDGSISTREFQSLDAGAQWLSDAVFGRNKTEGLTT